MFRFSIRDLLWLLTVIGLFFAWAMESRRLASQVDQVHQIEHKLSTKEAELNRVTDDLGLEKRRVKFYRSGIIGYPP
jgi:hypothetical protein